MEEKNRFCSRCGAELHGNRFCGACGFDTESRSLGENRTDSRAPVSVVSTAHAPSDAGKVGLHKAMSFMHHVTRLVSCLPSLFLMLLPAATVFGEKTGSVYYQAVNPILSSEGAGLRLWAIFMILANAVVLLATAIAIAQIFVPGAVPIDNAAGICFLCIMWGAILLVPPILLIVTLKDGGLQPGIGVILSLVFASVGIATDIVARIVGYFTASEDKASDSSETPRKRNAPVAVVGTICLIAGLAAVVLSVGGGVLSDNRLRAGCIKKIQAGTGQATVLDILGTPLEENDFIWVYCDKNYIGLYNAFEKIGEVDSLEDFEAALDQAILLEKLSEQLVYRRVTVIFDVDRKVKEIVLETDVCDSRKDAGEEETE